MAKPLWRNVSFMLMWSSVAASGFGDRLIQIAAWSMLGIHLVGADAASIQAGVSFFFFLPYVVLGPMAGWVADTLSRKWVMLFCDEVRAGILLLSFLLVPAGAAMAIPANHHWKVYGVITAVGVLAAVFSPAKAATIPQIVPVRQLQPANAIVLGIAIIASLIGFGVGGLISVQTGLAIGVLVYAVSGTFFAFLKLKPHTGQAVEPRPSQLERFIQAVGYIRRHRPIWELIGLSVLFWAAATVLLAAIAAMCKTRYGLDGGSVVFYTATMMAILGAGMLCSSLWVAWVNSRRESSWFVMLGLLLAGVLMLAMCYNRSYWFGLALVLGIGFWGNAAMICVATLTQSLAPNYIRGRIFGVRDLVNTSSAVLVNLAIWRLAYADRYMVTILYWVAGLLVVSALWGLWVALTTGPMGGWVKNLGWRLCRAYVLVWHRLRWVGRENVPTTGRVILAANHTTGLDPLLIQAAVPRVVRWLMMRSYRFRILEPLWREIQPIALDLDKSGIKETRQLLRELKKDQVVGIFPEGALQREHRVLQPFQPGIGRLAKWSGATIVPVWIDGTPKLHRMVWHFLLPSRTTIVFGKSFKAEGSMSGEDIIEELRQRMLELEECLKQEQRINTKGCVSD